MRGQSGGVVRLTDKKGRGESDICKVSEVASCTLGEHFRQLDTLSLY